MTRQEFINSLVELIGIMAEQNYSENIVEITLGLILPLTKQNKEKAVMQFAEIAKRGLPERDYHYEISQVFKALMEY